MWGTLACLTTSKPSRWSMNLAPNFHLLHRKPYSSDPSSKCLYNLQLCCMSWLREVSTISNNNSKQLNNVLNYTPLIFVCFSGISLHQQMISNHHRNPCTTAPVWVFFVQFSLRVITHNKHIFYTGWWQLGDNLGDLAVLHGGGYDCSWGAMCQGCRSRLFFVFGSLPGSHSWAVLGEFHQLCLPNWWWHALHIAGPSQASSGIVLGIRVVGVPPDRCPDILCHAVSL